VGGLGRLLVLAGAGGVAAGVALPWVRVKNAVPGLTILGAHLGPSDATVHGQNTSAWPVLAGLGAVVALLALLGRARRTVALLGVLIAAAGGGLLYYLSNVIDIKTAHRSDLERTLAHLAVHTSVQPGPVVLLGAGALITLGALVSRPRAG
jgi:hypothetical protein